MVIDYLARSGTTSYTVFEFETLIWIYGFIFNGYNSL